MTPNNICGCSEKAAQLQVLSAPCPPQSYCVPEREPILVPSTVTATKRRPHTNDVTSGKKTFIQPQAARSKSPTRNQPLLMHFTPIGFHHSCLWLNPKGKSLVCGLRFVATHCYCLMLLSKGSTLPKYRRVPGSLYKHPN